MKALSPLFLGMTLIFSLAGEAQSVTTVEDFDVTLMEGKWNTFASIPAPFQDDCDNRMSATYGFDGDEVTVKNVCFSVEGEKQEAKGRARIDPDYNDPARIQVTFIQIFGRWIWWPKGYFWVIGYLEDPTGMDESSMIVVGDPSAKYAWILSRDSVLSDQNAKWAEDVLLANGYDSCSLVMYDTEMQDFPAEKTFCEIVRP